ncbi:MAG: hypothetical protein IKA40_01780 [Clostridia bacterium]|nr:hypothetical protein [Clostridia bacterium]
MNKTFDRLDIQVVYFDEDIITGSSVAKDTDWLTEEDLTNLWGGAN